MKILSPTTLVVLALSAPLAQAIGAQAQSLQVEPTAETALAANATPPSAEELNAPALLSGWQLGTIASHGQYSEAGLMQVQGPRLGVSAARDWITQSAWQITVQGQLNFSAMHYTSPISGELANVPDLETDLRITALHPLRRSLNGGAAHEPGTWQWAAYSGLAHRLHYNDLRGTTTVGHIGYRRLNQRTYLPIGLQATRAGASALFARFEITPSIHGTHSTYMTDTGATRDATVLQKSQGWALQVGWQPQPGWRVRAHHRQWTTSATATWPSTRRGLTRFYIEPASLWRETGLLISREF